jgi:hypothetical protein
MICRPIIVHYYRCEDQNFTGMLGVSKQSYLFNNFRLLQYPIVPYFFLPICYFALYWITSSDEISF